MSDTETESDDIFISDELLDSFVIPALPDSGASFPAIPEVLSQKITDLGLEKLLSSLFGKNADGHVSQSHENSEQGSNSGRIIQSLMTPTQFT